MYSIDLAGKNGLVFGVATNRSIAWAITQVLSEAGARLALTYQNERLKDRVAKLTDTLDEALLLECDVSSDAQIESVFAEAQRSFGHLDFLIHSIAFANRDDLGGDFSATGREGFRLALDIRRLLPAAPGAPCGLVNGEGRRRERGNHDLPGVGASLPRIQHHGDRQGGVGERGPPAGGGVRRPEHKGQRHLGRNPWRPWRPGASTGSWT